MAGNREDPERQEEIDRQRAYDAHVAATEAAIRHQEAEIRRALEEQQITRAEIARIDALIDEYERRNQ